METPCSKCGCPETPKSSCFKTRRGKRKKVVSSVCVLCMREEYRMRYDRVKADPVQYKAKIEGNKRSSKKHAKRVKAYKKKWELLNAESISVRKAKYYEENKDVILAKKRAKRKDSREPRIITNKKHIWRVFENERMNDIKRRVDNIFMTEMI